MLCGELHTHFSVLEGTGYQNNFRYPEDQQSWMRQGEVL